MYNEPSPFASSDKIERRELIREVYEYRDAEGQLICTAHVEFEPVSDAELQEMQLTSGRKLKSLVLKDGDNSIDVLALVNVAGAVILISDKREMNYFTSLNLTVSAPPLKTPLDFAVLLHELGHADQLSDEYFALIQDLPVSVRDIKPYSYDFHMKALRETGVDKYLDSDLLMEALNLTQQELDLYELQRSAETREKIKKVNSRLDEICSELDPFLQMGRQIAERDATRRAIRGLRRIRDRGIDLLKAVQAPFKATTDTMLLNFDTSKIKSPRELACLDFLKQGIKQVDDDEFVNRTIVKDLQLGLASYRARTKEMKQRYGKIPRAILQTDESDLSESTNLDRIE